MGARKFTTPPPVTPPPNNGKPVIYHIDSFVSQLYKYSTRLYLNPDEAYRQSREQARAMRRDPVIMQPLRQRQLATALLDFQIQPEDDSDPIQKFVCEELTSCIKRIPYFLKMKMALLEAVWFGRYAAALQYQYCDDGETLDVKSWTPYHGDKLAFEQDTGNVGIFLGGQSYLEDGTDLRFGPESRVRMFSQSERDSLIIHKHEVEDGDFFEPEAAGGIHGIGLRTRVYWPWWIKQTTFQWLMTFMERAGLGVSIWYFQQGNDADYKSTKESAEKLSSDSVILAPVPYGSEKPFKRYERVEPGMGGAQLFKDILDDTLGGQIRGMIVGQEATSQKVSTGLGSEIAKVQQDTFQQIVEYDAINLSETITQDLVRILADWNFRGIDWTPRFELVVKKVDPKQFLEAAKMFQDMGGTVGEDQLREVIGLPAPGPEEKVLSPAPQVQQPGGVGAEGEGNPQHAPGSSWGNPQEDAQDQAGEEVEPRNGDDVDLPDGEYDIEHVREAMKAARGKGKPAKFARWKEEDHPRDDDGKFAEAEGGGATTSAPEKPLRLGPLMKSAGEEKAFEPDDRYEPNYALRNRIKKLHRMHKGDRKGQYVRLLGYKMVDGKKMAVMEDALNEVDRFYADPNDSKPGKAPSYLLTTDWEFRDKHINASAWAKRMRSEEAIGKFYISRDKKDRVKAIGRSKTEPDKLIVRSDNGQERETWIEDLYEAADDSPLRHEENEKENEEKPDPDKPKQKTLADYEKDRRAVQESVAKHGHKGGRDLSGFAKGEQDRKREREDNPLFAETDEIEKGRERQGRLFARRGQPERYKGEWLTIGKGNHGAKVFVENGIIKRGCPGLMGQQIDDIDEDNDTGSWEDYLDDQGNVQRREKPKERSEEGKKWDERSGNKRTRDEKAYQHAKRRQMARKEGLDPNEVENVYEWLRGEDEKAAEDHNSLIRAARKFAGVHHKQGDFGKGADASSLRTSKRGLDDVAAELAGSAEFAHHFRGDESPSETLFQKLSEGMRERKTDDDLWREAMEVAYENRGNKPQKKRTDDAVPFSRR